MYGYVDTFTPHEVWRNRYLVPNVKERGVLSCGPTTASLQGSTKSGSHEIFEDGPEINQKATPNNGSLTMLK